MKKEIFLPSSTIRISLQQKLKNQLIQQHQSQEVLPVLMQTTNTHQQRMHFTISELQVLRLNAE
ncbi:hypothetical protein D3C85_912070 [compost metagenome]